MQEKTRTRERAARKRGPAPFRPTKQQRRDAMLLMAGGIGEEGIAAIFRLSVNCLRKHFADELLHGRARKRGENLRRLERAAEEGAVTAMRVLQLVYDKAESRELHAREFRGGAPGARRGGGAREDEQAPIARAGCAHGRAGQRLGGRFAAFVGLAAIGCPWISALPRLDLGAWTPL